MKEVDFEDGLLLAKFKGEDFEDSLKLVKSLVGSNYVMETRIWKIPALKENIEKLKDNGFIFSKKSLVLLDEIQFKKVRIDRSKLSKKLYPFQVEGVEWLESKKGNGLIGDDMGLGKTAQAISYCSLHKEDYPVLVVAPSSLKLNWKKEIKMWARTSSVKVIYGESTKNLSKKDFYVINYDILAKRNSYEYDEDGKPISIVIRGWVKKFVRMGIKTLIIDECQMISSRSSLRTKAVRFLKDLLPKCKVIGLSGTPIKDRPEQFFTILNLVCPSLFNDEWRYLIRYCNGHKTFFGWDFSGSSNIEELNKLLTYCMIRRLKEDVLPQLPEKIKSMIPMELEEVHLKNYRDAEDKFRDWLDTHYSKINDLDNELARLKQLAYLAKRNSVLKWIEDFLGSGRKLVVMVYHKMAVEDIYSKFKKVSVKLDGDTPEKDRQKMVDLFQNNKNILLFVGQIIAAGVGITLVSASSLAVVECTYTPSELAQAEDRIHRIGQTADGVNIYYLVAPGTVDKDIVDILFKKYRNIKKILDGKEEEDFFKGSNILVEKLMSKYSRVDYEE